MIESQDTLTILTGLDDDADSCLTWKAGQEGLNGICTSNNVANQLDGCILPIFIQWILLLLADNTYQCVHQAFLSRNSFCTKIGGHASVGLERVEKLERKKWKKWYREFSLSHIIDWRKKMGEQVGVKSLVDYITKLKHAIFGYFSSNGEKWWI